MQTEAEAPAVEPLSLEGVTRRFGAVTALDGVGLQVHAHEVMAIVGPSGCGKSTLLELVAGLQEPDAGALSVAGARGAAARRAACAYMPQRDLLLPWRDALGNAALALECEGVPRREARRRAEPLFERFGLAEFERSRPDELSGRDAPAGVVPAHAPARPAGAPAGRALRRARRDHAARHAGVAGRRAHGRAAHRAARDARRGRGGLPRRPRGGALPAPGAGGRRVRGRPSRGRARSPIPRSWS